MLRAGTLFCLVLALREVVQVDPGGVHSLCYSIMLSTQPRPGQLHCDIQGILDEKPFFYYNSKDNRVQTLDPLGKKLYSTKFWGEQMNTLKDVRNVLKQQMADIKSEISTINGTDPLFLQSMMECHMEASGHSYGSWHFGFKGYFCLDFDSWTEAWRLAHPDCRVMMQRWVKDKDMTMFLKRISMGDCRVWLENILLAKNEELKTTEAPTLIQNSISSKTMVIIPSTWNLLVILLCSFRSPIGI